jgi:hypothetical protein
MNYESTKLTIMKKLLSIIMLAFSISVSASDMPLKVVNNTPYKFQYLMTTTYIGAVEPTYAFPLFRMNDLVTLNPYSTVVYDDPANPGLPFYMLPTSWQYYPTSWSSSTTVSGNTAYYYSRLSQKWASIKFNVLGTPFSGHIGPFQGSWYSETDPFSGVTITWIPSGSAVTIVLS